jgi:hypothetical protein
VPHPFAWPAIFAAALVVLLALLLVVLVIADLVEGRGAAPGADATQRQEPQREGASRPRRQAERAPLPPAEREANAGRARDRALPPWSRV